MTLVSSEVQRGINETSFQADGGVWGGVEFVIVA